MTDPNKDRAWIWIGYVLGEDGNPAARFTIDERLYPDQNAARMVVKKAGEELRRRKMPTEFETVLVRPDTPARSYQRGRSTDEPCLS